MTHHADDETLEYIASLEQRNAELVRLLQKMTRLADDLADTANIGLYDEDIDQARAFLAKTKE